MLRIVFYTSGVSGIGRLVHGIALYNAFVRKQEPIQFTIVSSAPKERLSILSQFDIDHVSVPKESNPDIDREHFPSSVLFSVLSSLNPDVLIVDRMWFTLYHMESELPFKKVFITGQVSDALFSIPLPEGTLDFQPAHYDRVIGIEPFESSVAMEYINPMIIRNRDEIDPREKALIGLGLSGDKPVCFVGMNFEQGYFEKLKQKYSYLQTEGYDVLYSTNLSGSGIFPIADYYHAVDLIIGAATYNQFWETRFFEKEAVLEPVPVRFCNQHLRLQKYSDYTFTDNGADQLAEIIVNL